MHPVLPEHARLRLIRPPLASAGGPNEAASASMLSRET